MSIRELYILFYETSLDYKKAVETLDFEEMNRLESVLGELYKSIESKKLEENKK